MAAGAGPAAVVGVGFLATYGVTAGLTLAYTQSETFRNLVDEQAPTLDAGIAWVSDAFANAGSKLADLSGNLSGAGYKAVVGDIYEEVRGQHAPSVGQDPDLDEVIEALRLMHARVGDSGIAELDSYLRQAPTPARSSARHRR